MVGNPGGVPEAPDQDAFKCAGSDWVMPAQCGGCMKGDIMDSMLEAVSKIVLCGVGPEKCADAWYDHTGNLVCMCGKRADGNVIRG